MSAPGWAVSAREDVTPAWLSDLLGLRVDDVEVTQVGTGQIGTCYRLRPTGARELPASLLLKLPDPGSRELLAGAYAMELMFYDRIAPTLSCRVPEVHGARIEPGTGWFVLLLEDLAPLVQGDQVEGATPAQVLDAAVNLAGLHGPRWCDPSLLELPGLTLNDEDSVALLEEMYPSTLDLFVEGLGDLLDAETVATLRDCVPLTRSWLLGRPERFGLVHGDYRLDNLMFTPGGGPGEVAALDWQTLSLALPARDLAYLVATSLEPDVRREVERDVVAAYHRRLVGLGVEDYDLGTCWEDYRFGQLQVPLVATFGCAYGARTPRGDRMFAAMVRRSAAAIRDLGTLDLV
ncbi:phosphotransferase [Nocardioides ginkgobilobae]